MEYWKTDDIISHLHFNSNTFALYLERILFSLLETSYMFLSHLFHIWTLL